MLGDEKTSGGLIFGAEVHFLITFANPFGADRAAAGGLLRPSIAQRKEYPRNALIDGRYWFDSP